MRKVCGFLIFTLILIFYINNCECTPYWAKTFGGSNIDHVFSIQQTIDEGFIVAGYSYSYGAGGYDIWILKLTDKGTVEWEKTYGSIYNDYARSVQQTQDQGYIIAGYTSSSISENFDFLIIKLDAQGNISWQKTYGGIYSDTAREIQQTSDGGYIITGYTDSFGTNTTDIWVIKLDASGDVSWEKTYGGSGSDIARSIQQTSDGGFIVAGQTQSFGASDSYLWVLKLDMTGEVGWQNIYSGEGFDGATSIQQTQDGGYIVAGSTIPSLSGTFDIWALKLDGNGNVSWQKTYGGAGDDYPVSLQQTSDRWFVIAGWTTSFGAGIRDYLIIKLDSNGDIIWQKTYGGSLLDEAHYIRQTSDGGYVVAGDSFSSPGGSLECMIIKIDTNGEIPNCQLMRPANAATSIPAVTVQSSNAAVLQTASTVTNTNLFVQDTLTNVSASCCYDTEDFDCDNILNTFDNCPDHPNSYLLGTCLKGTVGAVCINSSECGESGVCSLNQEDSLPDAGGNGIGDACECEGDFDCDRDVDGSDISAFGTDFGRNPFNSICSTENPCTGDFNCDGDVDGSDAVLLKADFGRSFFSNACPFCFVGMWCAY